MPIVRQLTNRDRTLLRLLYDHKVLTTEQITAALFPNRDTAQHRLIVPTASASSTGSAGS